MSTRPGKASGGASPATADLGPPAPALGQSTLPPFETRSAHRLRQPERTDSAPPRWLPPAEDTAPSSCLTQLCPLRDL